MTKFFCDKCGKQLSTNAGERYRATIRCRRLLGSDEYDADFCEDCIKGIVGAEVLKAHEEKEAARKERAEARKRESEERKANAETD